MDIKTVLIETISELEYMRATIDARLRALRAAAREAGCDTVAGPSPETRVEPTGGQEGIAAEIARQRGAIMAEVDKIRQAALAQAASAQREAATASAGSAGLAPGLGLMDGLGGLHGGARLHSELLKQIAARHEKKPGE